MIQKRAVFVDTWGWLALGHHRDSFHGKVQEVFAQMQMNHIPLFSSEYVFDELITLLFRRENYNEAVKFAENLFAAAGNNELVIEKVTEQRFYRAWQLRKWLRDKPHISFTDITSMIIMQDLSISYVLTDDEHFLHVGFGFSKIP